LIEDAVIAIIIGCSLHAIRYLLMRFVGAPAWLEGREEAEPEHSLAATASQSSDSLTTTSASK
jgi:hypothetical protein